MHVYRTQIRFHAKSTDEVEVSASNGGIHYIELTFAPHGTANAEVEFALAIDELDGLVALRDALDAHIYEQTLRGAA